MTDIAGALLAGTRAAPRLDPNIVYGITQASDLGDVVDHAQATEAFGEMTKRAQYLRGQDDNIQVAAWSAAGDAERRMLTAAGYEPPAIGKHGGLWSSVAHGVGSVADTLFVEPAKQIEHGVSGILHLMGAGLRNVQHGYRTSWLLSTQGFEDDGQRGSLFSPADWAKAWRESEHGEQTFRPDEERKVRERYTPDTADMAKRIAGGTPVDQIILEAPEAQRQTLAQRLESDPDLKSAVADYNAIKFSFGRMLIGPNAQKKLTVKLPESVPFMGGAEVNPVSGGIDGTADWFGDPLVLGISAAKGAELARYMVRGPDDVERLIQSNGNVQRALADVSETLNAGGAGALIERWPRLAPVAEQLVKEGVDSPERLGEWFKGQAGMTSILSGRSTGISHATPTMLKLNVREAAMLEVKGGLKKAIDWMADTPLGIASATGDEQTAGALRQFAVRRTQGFGRIARQSTTLTARGFTFDPLAQDSVTTIQRLANYVLPADRVRDLVNVWSAAPDLATKRSIYKGLLGEMADAAGITATEEGRRWLSGFTSKIDDAVDKPIYSASGADRVVRDGVEKTVGLLEPHLTTEWSMPPYRELWAQAKRANTLGRVYQGTVNADGISRFMEGVWKPSTLLRFGFPVRAGGEELVAAIMREGPLGLIRGRAAAGATKGEALGAADRLAPLHPLASVWRRVAGHLPEELVSRVEAPADFVGVVVGDRARRAFRSVEGALAGEDYLNAARELWRRGPLQSSFLAEASAVEGRAGGYLDDTETLIKAAKEGRSARPAFFAPRGNFVNYKPGETLYVQMWKKNLDEIADSQLGQAALRFLDDPADAVDEVKQVIQSPAFKKMAGRSDRMLHTTEGRMVGVDATAEEAAHDWAVAVVDHVNSLVRDVDGSIIGDLPTRLLAGEVPTTAGLAETPFERMPSAVKGREVVEVSRNWARDLMDRGFQQVVGRPMDWMVRQPLFVHNYALAQKEAEALRPLVGAGEHADAVVHDVAMHRAINKTTPFIHDPKLRSQMSVVTRNLAPFWFAQEQFYKRWARIFEHSPEAFRQAQLVMMGLRHSGVLHTDDQGNDFFIYPGPAVVQNAISKGFEMVTGRKVSLPLPVGFSGQVRFATPGLERLGVPSFGPLVGIPVHAMSTRFPEMSQVEEGVLGERGAGRAYWEMITPTTVSRLVHIATDNPETSPQMASAMMQAMQYLEAAGYSPADNASPVEREAYIDRVKSWTRILFLNRMLFGFAAPAAPELQMDPSNLSDEFRELMKSMPIEEAQAEFIRRHPDATPYTVFQSKSASGAPLPATEHTVAFMNANEEFLRTYPQAGGWFLPQAPDGEEFNYVAYREQLGLEMRRRKTPDEFYRDLKYAEAADTYFRSRDKKDLARDAAKGNSARIQAIDHAWADWKGAFLTAHPVFSEELQSPDAQIRRQQTIDQLHQALADPRLPHTPQTATIAGLMDAYDQVDVALQRLAGFTSSTAERQRKAIRGAFAKWGEQYVTQHPDAKGLWDKTFRGVAEGSG